MNKSLHQYGSNSQSGSVCELLLLSLVVVVVALLCTLFQLVQQPGTSVNEQCWLGTEQLERFEP